MKKTGYFIWLLCLPLISLAQLQKGAMAPDFEQQDTIGKMIRLSDFKGKYVLLDFWASWCVPCRAENPGLVECYNKFKEKGFTILSVSLDRDKRAWKEAIERDHLTWTHVSDLKYWRNAAAKLYGVIGVPDNFLIGPDGKVIAKELHGDELKQTLTEIFK